MPACAVVAPKLRPPTRGKLRAISLSIFVSLASGLGRVGAVHLVMPGAGDLLRAVVEREVDVQSALGPIPHAAAGAVRYRLKCGRRGRGDSAEIPSLGRIAEAQSGDDGGGKDREFEHVGYSSFDGG